jgi:outer membrane receptor protein involved in Fe transport
VWNYELGAKTAWLDRRLSVNAAIYDIHWGDIQQGVFLPSCGLSVVLNSGTAVSKGAELEIQYATPFGLRLAVAAGFNSAQLTHSAPGAATQAGTPLLNFPKQLGSASAEYTRELGAQTSGYVRVDVNTASYKLQNYDPTSLFYKEPGYSLANLRVGVRRNAWQSSLFVTNLLDKHAETALPTSAAIDLPTQRRFALNRPRTIGIDLRYERGPAMRLCTPRVPGLRASPAVDPLRESRQLAVHKAHLIGRAGDFRDHARWGPYVNRCLFVESGSV